MLNSVMYFPSHALLNEVEERVEVLVAGEAGSDHHGHGPNLDIVKKKITYIHLTVCHHFFCLQ